MGSAKVEVHPINKAKKIDEHNFASKALNGDHKKQNKILHIQTQHTHSNYITATQLTQISFRIANQATTEALG